MSAIPSPSCKSVLKAPGKSDFVIVRRRDGHIRLQKNLEAKTIKLTIPEHNLLFKKGTPGRIIKDSGLSVEEFLRGL